MDEHSIPDEDLTEKGELGKDASKIIMKILYCARCMQYEILYPTVALARQGKQMESG